MPILFFDTSSTHNTPPPLAILIRSLKLPYSLLTVALITVAGFVSCSNLLPEGAAHGSASGHAGHAGHVGGAGSSMYTLYAAKTELFVEFPTLIVGKGSAFAAHITTLADFKPALIGALTVTISSGTSTKSASVQSPANPGIFRPELTPEKPGVYTMNITYEQGEVRDQFTIPSVQVFANEQEALAVQLPGSGPGPVSYLKEQSWKTEFATAEVIGSNFWQNIKTSGEVMAAQGDEQVISAPSSGVVVLTAQRLIPGAAVGIGQELISITGAGHSSGNIELQFRETRSEFEKASADFERGQLLHKDTIISAKDLSEITNRFEKAKAAYELLAANYTRGGRSVVSPVNGFLRNLLVAEGQFVEAGTPLFVVAKNKHLLIRADVPQKYAAILPEIFSANFSTGFGNPVHSLEELGGELVSTGKNVSRDNPYLSIYFKIINQGEFVPGGFVDIILMAGKYADAITVPVTALMEEHGLFRVYVQKTGESFEKREVEIGGSDGLRTQIHSGLATGERIVVRGTRQMQLATATGAIPSAHGHAH